MSVSYPPNVEPAPTARRNPLGVISFIVGAAAVVISRFLGLVAPFLISTGLSSSYELITTLNVVSMVLSLVLGLAALVLGVIVLLQRGAPKGFAAAGAALGGAELFGALVGLAQTVAYYAGG